MMMHDFHLPIALMFEKHEYLKYNVETGKGIGSVIGTKITKIV